MSGDYFYIKYKKYKKKYNNIKYLQIGGDLPKPLGKALDNTPNTDLHIYQYKVGIDGNKTYVFLETISRENIKTYIDDIKNSPTLSSLYYCIFPNTKEIKLK